MRRGGRGLCTDFSDLDVQAGRYIHTVFGWIRNAGIEFLLRPSIHVYLALSMGGNGKMIEKQAEPDRFYSTVCCAARE